MIITATWPAAWNWRSFSRTTTWPSWMSGAVGSLQSVTRSGRALPRRRWTAPAGSTSTDPRVRPFAASPPSRPGCRIGAMLDSRVARGRPEAGAVNAPPPAGSPDPSAGPPRFTSSAPGSRSSFMPESRDNTEEDQVTTSGNGASPNGSADDAADVATRVDTESATEPGDPTVAGRNGDVDSADADPDLTPREQAKQPARERAGERKRQREERRAARRESGSALTERIAR